MKNRLWWLAGTTAVVLFFHCCTNDPCDYGGDVGEKASEHFPAQEARAYFEQTAEDLRMVHIGCRHEHGDCGHGHGQSTKGILNEVEQAGMTCGKPTKTAKSLPSKFRCASEALR